jgi:hypothetical protein
MDTKAAQPSPTFGGGAADSLLLLLTDTCKMPALMPATHHQRQQTVAQLADVVRMLHELALLHLPLPPTVCSQPLMACSSEKISCGTFVHMASANACKTLFCSSAEHMLVMCAIANRLTAASSRDSRSAAYSPPLTSQAQSSGRSCPGE